MGYRRPCIPAVTRLEFSAPRELVVTSSPKLTTVTSLNLENMVNIDILSTISLLPCLSHLGLDTLGLTPASETTQVISNSLRTLKLNEIEDHSWLLRLTCPKLDTLVICGSGLSDTCASFIRIHNSITTLDVDGDNNSITTLASIFPQARVLGSRFVSAIQTKAVQSQTLSLSTPHTAINQHSRHRH